MVPYKFRKLVVRFVFLERQDFADARIGRFGQFDLPTDQSFVNGSPVGERARLTESGSDLPELAAVIRRALFGHQLLAVDILFDRQQHLVRIDRFDQVIGDFRAYRLIHDILLLAFGDHDHRRSGADFLDLR